MAVNNNKPLLDRKEPQMMSPFPVASVAGACVISDDAAESNLALYLFSATAAWLYHHDEDGAVQTPSPALAGIFGAGTCGCMAKWSNAITANGGSTTSATTAANLNGLANGAMIRFLTGANAGIYSTVSKIVTNPGANATLQFAALPNAVANTDTFQLDTGLFFVLNAGTISAGSFKSYDAVSGVWTTLNQVGLPAAWGTDGNLVKTYGNTEFANGTATGATSTTLVNSAKAWGINQWCNYQVRIIAGTGIGQIRNIATNTGTTLTNSVAWTVTPDATSQYKIEANEDNIYLVGNNAVTLYKYSRSANTWATVAPTVARAAAPGSGMGNRWIGKTGDAVWADESNIRDGRYIYCPRGGGSGAIDRFDIAGGTNGAGAWQVISYNNLAETFTTGSSYFDYGKYIYIKKDNTNRFFKFSVTGNYLEPLTTLMYADGTSVVGNKIWVKKYDVPGAITWLYSLGNTLNVLHRVMLF